MKKSLLLSFLLLLLSVRMCSGQNNTGFTLNVDYIPNSDTLHVSDTIKCTLSFIDTTDIAKIHIELTRFDNNQVVFHNAFLWNSNNALPTGSFIKKKDKDLIITLGSFPFYLYDGQVAVEDKAGKTTSPVLFVR